MHSAQRIFTAALLGAVLTTIGCGGGNPVSVEGVVTLDDVPVSNAMVIFHPANSGPQANGLTDQEGVFHLTTYNTGDGALPGSYKVTVQRLEAKGDAATTGVNPNDPDSMHKAMGEFLGKDPRKEVKKAQPSSLPATYGHADSTPLKYQVPFSGRIKIELKSKGGT
jgi:hypothetical protein